MSELVTEVLLRATKLLMAAVIGLVLYLALVGPLGVPGSAQLALEAWIAGALAILLLETSPI
jgi:hypothetical protein